MLCKAGATVELCRTAEAALNSLANGKRFDAVITDLHLGNETAGWQVAQAALAGDPDVSVFVVSGHLPEVSPLGIRYGSRLNLRNKPLVLKSLLPG